MSDTTNTQVQTQEQNIYKEATRKKLSFSTFKGEIKVEDLWSLPLISNRANELTLDVIATDLANKLSQQKVSSVVNPEKKSKEMELLELRFTILKDVIATRKEEISAYEKEEQRIADAKKIKEMIANKQDESLNKLTIEELQARLNMLKNT
jgi:hypothetical protein